MKYIYNIKPIGKQRVRVTRNGTYTPPKTKEFQEQIRWMTKQQGVEYLTGALQCTIRAEFAVPKSYSKKKRKELLERWFHTNKPDADNIAKAVLDALNGLLYEDDSQVVDLNIYKVWGEKDEITFIIEALEN